MTGTPTLLAVVIALSLLWTLGGLALRLGGALVFWAGLIGFLATGDLAGPPVALLGALVWLAGQGHRALRHGGVPSPLARVLLGALPGLRAGKVPDHRDRDRP